MKLNLEARHDGNTVLGIRLVPLTLGHWLHLQNIGNPFATGERRPGHGDLLTALLICSLPQEEAARLLRSGVFPVLQEAAAAELLRRAAWLRIRRSLWLTRAAFGPLEFHRAVNAFFDYLEAGRSRPEYQAALHRVTTSPAAPCLN